MRRAALLFALLVVAPGCFVLDELEAGRKIMEQHSPKTEEQREAARSKTSSTSSDKRAGEGLVAQVQSWIAKQKSALEEDRAAADPDDVPIRCEIRGKMHFVRKSDCQLRGGHIL